MSTTAYVRDTRFEIHQLTQKANSYVVSVSDRNRAPTVATGRLVAPMMPDLELHESVFTEDEHALAIRFFTMIEEKYAEAYDGHAGDVVERTKEHVTRMLEAKSAADAHAVAAQAQRAAAEAAAADRQTFEAMAAAAQAEHALVSLQLAEQQAKLADVKAALKETADAPG